MTCCSENDTWNNRASEKLSCRTRKHTWQHLAWVGQTQVGWGISIFVLWGLGPSIYCLPPKNGHVRHIFAILVYQTNVTNVAIRRSWKDPKNKEITPKIVQFSGDPLSHPLKIHKKSSPPPPPPPPNKKKSFFWKKKHTKISEFKIVYPKNGPSLRTCWIAVLGLTANEYLQYYERMSD